MKNVSTVSPCLVAFLSYFDYGALTSVNRQWKTCLGKCKAPDVTWQSVYEEVFQASGNLVEFAQYSWIEQGEAMLFNLWGAEERKIVISYLQSGRITSDLRFHRLHVHKPCSMTWQRFGACPEKFLKPVPNDREALQRFVRRQTGGHYSLDIFPEEWLHHEN